MAHCARLNLRMQKELKLLLTDPPSGADFPTLSDDSSASSLTSIDTLLQGPEGTVYANGVFKIKIQIPERYPFQPPIVTFATPIYHPNIDNGGRICLDILNLPPKGMWQPSLNISTVLTSIGLLLSEPNPDDGLMHEASRDYKYNRQAFDQNARSMTEKYARAGETENAGSSHGTQANAGRSTAESKMEGSGASVSIAEHRKLLLESPGSSGNKGDNHKHIEYQPLKESNTDLSKYTGNLGKLQATRNKLSLKVPVSSHSRNGESEKENLAPVRGVVPQLTDQSTKSLVSEYGQHCNEKRPKTGLKLRNDAISDKKQQINGICVGESSYKFKLVAEAEAVIVLDSEEESEDEVFHARSKLSLAKRCLSRKRKMVADR